MALVNKFEDQENPWRRWMIAMAGVATAAAIIAYGPLEGSYGQYFAGFISIAIIAAGLIICGLMQKRYYAWEAEHAKAALKAPKKKAKRPHKKH